MMVLLLLVHGIKAGARKEGLLAMAGVLVLFLAYGRFHARIMLFIRRHFQPEALDALEEDPRPNILFLRSFHADNQFGVRTGNWLTTLFGKANVPLEAALTEQFQDFGPVIAIGRPGEPLPPLGASRFYAPKDGEEWKRHVTEFASAAQLVVVMLGETEGLRWEYDLLARANWLGKTVFVVPLVKGNALKKVLRVFRKYTEDWGIEIVAPVDVDVVVFAPAGHGRLVPLSAPGLRTRNHVLAPSAKAYREPINTILDKASGSFPPRAAAAIDTQDVDLAEPMTVAATVVFPRRIQALFVDWIISVMGLIVLVHVVWMSVDPSIMEHPPKSKESEEVTQQIMVTGMLLSPLLLFVLEGLLGISLGKRWCGLRVLCEDGSRPSRARGLVRTLIKAASTWICVFPLAALFGVLGMAWHDRATGTMVVAVRKRR